MQKCIIFGASKTGAAAYRLLEKTYEVIGFSDNASKKWDKEFCGKKIFAPEMLTSMKDTIIIIASVYYSLIHRQLRDMGINSIKVFFYKGQAELNNSDEFYLYELSDDTLFGKCIYDIEKIEKIKNDISENYSSDDFYNEGDIRRITVNNGNRKKVLFCAYIFPPYGGGGVQRSLKFVKYLKKYGYEPIVLTVGENDGKIEKDMSMLKEIPEDISVIRIDNDRFLPELLSQTEQQEIFNLYCGVVESEKWADEYKKIIQNLDARLVPDNRIIWVNECLKRIEQLLDLNEIDIVYTTGNPYSTYILGFYLKKKYGMKWVQDYRDPWMNNKYYEKDCHEKFDKVTRNLQVELEKKLVRESNAIIVVEKSFKEDYKRDYDVSLSKVYEIVNGYDENDFIGIEKKEKTNKFTLCHNGTVYLDRSPVKLLFIINELIDEERINADEISWIFNGSVDGAHKNELDEADRYKIVKYNGYLSHVESINVAVNSDMLILFGHVAGCGGKLFEYLRMKRPILCLSNERLSDDVLIDMNAGKCFLYDESESIKKYIMENYSAWKNDNPVLETDICEIKKYSREYNTKSLADIFNKLLKES